MAKSAKSKKPKSARRAAAADPRGLPGGTTTPTLRDPRLKKIWVYSEGTFVLHNASEIKKLVIATKAFDVSGWIDLSKMQPGGNTIFTEVRVSFAESQQRALPALDLLQPAAHLARHDDQRTELSLRQPHRDLGAADDLVRQFRQADRVCVPVRGGVAVGRIPHFTP